MQKPELIDLLLNTPVNINSENGHEVVDVRDREHPIGFAEHFWLLLDSIPNKHATLRREFWSHMFLGSVLNLPYSSLMEKLKIKNILLKLYTTEKEATKNYDFNKLKLVFNISDNNHHQLKIFTIQKNYIPYGEACSEYTSESREIENKL